MGETRVNFQNSGIFTWPLRKKWILPYRVFFINHSFIVISFQKTCGKSLMQEFFGPQKYTFLILLFSVLHDIYNDSIFKKLNATRKKNKRTQNRMWWTNINIPYYLNHPQKQTPCPSRPWWVSYDRSFILSWFGILGSLIWSIITMQTCRFVR